MSALEADMPHRAEERSALGADMPHRPEERRGRTGHTGPRSVGDGHATQGDRRLSKEHVRLGGGHATQA
jgi:hypothetical protein